MIVENNIEVEYKLNPEKITKEDFHSKIESVMGKAIEPFYFVSCDDYYSNPEISDTTLRYRKSREHKELTLKVKKNGNVIRKEINLNISSNNDSSIVEFIKISGYQKRFSVFKEAWVFHLVKTGETFGKLECDAAYYTLSDGRSFIELEAVNCNSSEEGVANIDRWLDILSLTNLTKETRSLFEIYSQEKSIQ